jgi:hypothetical protein
LGNDAEKDDEGDAPKGLEVGVFAEMTMSLMSFSECMRLRVLSAGGTASIEKSVVGVAAAEDALRNKL